MVIDAGDHLDLGAVEEEEPADDVHLPQLHGPATFPAPVVSPRPLAGGGLNQAMADESPVHRRAPRQRRDALGPQLGEDPAWTPPRVGSTQLDNGHLSRRCHLMGTAVWSRALVGQGSQAAIRITTEPGVHR